MGSFCSGFLRGKVSDFRGHFLGGKVDWLDSSKMRSKMRLKMAVFGTQKWPEKCAFFALVHKTARKPLVPVRLETVLLNVNFLIRKKYRN